MFLLIMNENNMKNREYDVKNGLHSVFYISNRVFFHIGKWFDLWSPTKQKTKSIVNIIISLTGPQQTDSISFDYTPHYTDTPSDC